MSITSTKSKKIDEILSYLFDLNRLGIKVGLDHTVELLNRCGNPQNNFQSIHIAGTNGKGSICSMLASILMDAGYKVGLYSSPHLINFNERIRINNICITNNEIASFIEKKRKDIDEIKSTFFETTTAMAFDHFSLNRIDIAVVETGLGGRLDATNVIDPIITGISSISLDHRDMLGDNIVKIAKEKAGIIKKGIPVFISPQKKSVRSILFKTAAKIDSPIIQVKEPSKVFYNKDGTYFDYNNISYTTPLIGEFQALNALMAIAIVKKINNKITHKTIQKGLAKTVWHGRLQRMSEFYPIYYDVAHNQEGIALMLETIKSLFSQKPIGLFVMKGDKELKLISNILKNKFYKLVISGGKQFGLLNAHELSKNLKNYNFDQFSANNDFDIALENIIKLTKQTKKPTIIFGSHYIAKPIFDKFGFYN